MSVIGWGHGKSGALGTGQLNDHLLPVVVAGRLQGKNIVGIGCGEQHSVAVDDLGVVYAWGRNREGQCGQDFQSSILPEPHRVDSLLHERVVKVFAGSNQSFAITDDGKLYRWGLFHERALNSTPQYFGLTGMKDISDQTKEMIDRSHYLYFSNKKEIDLEDASRMSEDVEAVGAFRRRSISKPEVVEVEGKKVVHVAPGYCFYLVVTQEGDVYSFGFNDKGQLGLGTRFSHDSPQRITSLEGRRVVKAIAGQQHSVVLFDDGKVASWGGGVFGIGHGDGEDLLEPKIIEALSDKKVVDLSSGTYHTFLVTDEGEIFSFGHGEYGQQGTGDQGEKGEQSRNALLPRKLQNVPWEKESELEEEEEEEGEDGTKRRRRKKKVKQISCGHLHTLFVLEDGTVWSCGWGTHGVLGHGDHKYRLLPIIILPLQGHHVLLAQASSKHNLVVVQASNSFAFDFETLLTSPKNTDIIFHVDKKPIHAHQSIVCFRCPKIRAMVAMNGRFSRKSGTPEFVIKGSRFVVFKAMIYYLYTDHLNVPPFFAPEVAALASSFQLPRLYGLAQQLFFRSKKEKIVLPPSTFSQDLAQLIESEKLSDIQFHFSNPPQVFYGHKGILTSRCQYFRTMFEGGHFRDRESRDINMDHCPVSGEIFGHVIRYIYTGDRSVVEGEMALDLLGAADFFLLDDLKRICEDVAEKHLESCLLEGSEEGEEEEKDEKDQEEGKDQEILEGVRETAQMYQAKRLEYFCQSLLLSLSPAS